YVDIAERLKRDILRGIVAPGQRLPTRVELERQFDTTPVTLNRAMKRLVSEGFVQARMGSGTHVATHPPHLAHFALAFPFAVVQGASRFYEALRDEAGRLQASERRVSPFYGIESHVDEEDYQRLLGFVRAHRLAGLIFAANPYQLVAKGSPLIREPGVLRTAIMVADSRVSFPTVYPDIDAFLPKAFDYLAARGRKRVAVVRLGGATHVSLDPVKALAAERGLILRPHWLQAAFVGTPEWSRQTALLLLHAGQAERPDAVVIADDNLVEGFTEGIRDSGLRVVPSDEPCRTASNVTSRTACGEPRRTDDLEVVAQANFPYATRSLVPAKRLGYSITQLMAVCLERIEQQRHGDRPQAHTAIPAVWEEES
ncbi:MAG: GntR family transcriptional regulator, partial [Actinomycetes bacterium]